MIRRATLADLPVIENIYAIARQFMADNGNPTQWGDGYPKRELLESDIEKGELEEIVEFLKAPQKFSALGAKIPRGVLLVGPPGTGKSQTITSLISEFVSNGKTVLMVSEKKTALDVVYSRLGNLSQYALLIDDVGNKDAFYHQLLQMVSLGRWTAPRRSPDRK